MKNDWELKKKTFLSSKNTGWLKSFESKNERMCIF